MRRRRMAQDLQELEDSAARLKETIIDAIDDYGDDILVVLEELGDNKSRKKVDEALTDIDSSVAKMYDVVQMIVKENE